MIPTRESRTERSDGVTRDRAFRVARIPSAWYFACTSGALGKRPVAITILDQPLVLYRGRDGRAAALLDRCAHRNAPLSLGRVRGDRLACGYHGWEYGADGVCRRVPALSGRAETSARCVPSFAVRETQGTVWVFAAPDTSPHCEPFTLPHVGEPSYGTFRIDYHVEASLHATLENMLDVPHTAFLHRGLFRGGEPRRLRVVVRRDRDRVAAQYLGEPLPKGLAARILGVGALRAADAGTGAGNEEPPLLEHFDRFVMPSISQVEYGLGRNRFVATSLLTPESDFVTRFHTVVAYRLPLPRLVMRALFKPVAMRILGQDARMLARQSANVRRFGSESYVSTAVDVLGPEIWRMLERGERGLDAGDTLERELELLV